MAQENVIVNPAGDGNDTSLQEDKLDLLIKLTKKNLMWRRISAVCMVVIMLCVVVSAAIIVPKSIQAIDQANVILRDTKDLVKDSDKVLARANESLEQFDVLSGNLNNLILANSDTLTSSFAKIESIDFEGLNKAINDLASIVEPLAKLFGKR